MCRGYPSPALLLSSQMSRLLCSSSLLPSISLPTTRKGCHDDLDTAMIQQDECAHDDSISSMSLPDMFSGLSLNMEHLIIFKAHPSTCKCGTCSNVLHICHEVKLVILVCQISLLDASNHVNDHVNDHVTHLIDSLVTADINLVQLMKKHKVSSQTKSHGRRRVGKRGAKRVVPDRSRGCDVDNIGLFDCLRAEMACIMAECHLLLWQPDSARTLVMEALDRLQEREQNWCTHDHLLRLVLAHLHLLGGQALAQSINGRNEVIAERGVWCGQGEKLRKCFDEFLACYELCFPVRPAVLLREVCLWLAFLSSESADVHHYVSLAQQVSLTHRTTIVLGKKIRSAYFLFSVTQLQYL